MQDQPTPNTLINILDETAETLGIYGEQRTELYANLGGAIVLNLAGKLKERLSEEKQKELEKRVFKTPEELGDFFIGEGLSEEEFQELFSESAEEVLTKFMEKF